MRVLFAIAAVLLLGFSTNARAETSQADVRKLELARQFIDVAHLLDPIEGAMDQLAPLMADSVRQSQPDWSSTQVNQYVSMFREEFTKLQPQMREEIAQEYAGRFSADELQAFVTFFSTGAGSRLATETMALQESLSRVGQRMGMMAGMNAMTRMEAGN